MGMVSAMDPMKFLPLAGGQRPKDRMLGYRFTSAELVVTGRDHFLHAGDVFKDFGSQLRDGRTLRQNPLRGFASGRKIAQPGNRAALPALGLTIKARTGFPRRQATLTIFYGAPVGQIQVVQYIR